MQCNTLFSEFIENLLSNHFYRQNDKHVRKCSQIKFFFFFNFTRSFYYDWEAVFNTGAVDYFKTYPIMVPAATANVPFQSLLCYQLCFLGVFGTILMIYLDFEPLSIILPFVHILT